MPRLTDDPNDPELTYGTDRGPQAPVYLVLSEEERASVHVRPVRRSYWHKRGDGSACGIETQMPHAIAATFARDPKFYGSTYCVGCQGHFPVSEFDWVDGTVVGS